MIKICDYPCNDKREAEKEEDRYMMELKANMNMKREFRNQQEYYEENKDTIKLKQNQYREDNADVIKGKKKKYYEKNKQKINEKVNCLCGCEVNKHHLKRHQTSKKHIDFMNNQSL